LIDRQTAQMRFPGRAILVALLSGALSLSTVPIPPLLDGPAIAFAKAGGNGNGGSGNGGGNGHGNGGGSGHGNGDGGGNGHGNGPGGGHGDGNSGGGGDGGSRGASGTHGSTDSAGNSNNASAQGAAGQAASAAKKSAAAGKKSVDRAGASDAASPDTAGPAAAITRPSRLVRVESRPRPVAADPLHRTQASAVASVPIEYGRPVARSDRLLVTGLDDAALRQLRRRGYRVALRTNGSLAPQSIALQVPRGVSLSRAQRVIARLSKAATTVPDTIYLTAGDDACTSSTCRAIALVDWPQAQQCRSDLRIGMVDTAIDLDHPALRGQQIEMVGPVRDPDVDLIADAPPQPGSERPASDTGSASHGTAVAALLVGRQDTEAPGLMPSQVLLAVDAFHRAADGTEQTDAATLVQAIETLVARGVDVINLSLAGPPNPVLEATVRAAAARGVVIVAAAGNNGPGAKPSYPAAYPDVIAATAVDDRLAVYDRATQGDYVALSAPGVGLKLAAVNGKVEERSGTSYAVPFVVAAALGARSRDPALSPAQVKEKLESAAFDLGAPGPDPVFGAGLVRVESCRPEQREAGTLTIQR
jgi:hypothetical protein